ncbi:MAG: Mur ligase family protein [Actinomycetota bacterium]|nr:Mur ligase family protein [Actinomycetota bacterium]
MGTPRVTLVELRVLDGPNLYFPRPAIKLTLAVPAWMALPEERAAALAARLGLPSGPGARPGTPGTVHRRRFAARLAGHLTRRLAAATGTNLAVRSRAGPEPDQVVVAYPWRRRNAAEVFGREAAALMAAVLDARRSFHRAIVERAAPVFAADPGPSPTVPAPSIPVVAVTGTNGKTTTVRLLAHIGRTAGLSVAYSSTDGVYVDGRLIEEGDYSGFGGAGTALTQPGVQLAVLETARGGILLRGIGTAHNDVAVVTNVSADHLGLHGIHTLDQLSEVKSTIVRITRPDGWDVLNADDPRVLAMRRLATGRSFLYSLDADHPALRIALAEHGRAMTVIDGALAVLDPGHDPEPLILLEDVPVTLAGISRHNIHNAMAAAAAALSVGLPTKAVVRGLRTFVLDPETNPGRANLFELDGRIVVVDYAHNEAGMAGLTELARGLRAPGRAIWLTYGAAGDRTDEVLHGMGYLAARGADHVAVAELHRYLRGRDARELVDLLITGADDGGATDVPVFPDEIHALEWMLASSKRADVVVVTALGQRPEIFKLLEGRGAKRVGPSRVRQLVRRARSAVSLPRGSHT